jgi:hypothetical protein
MAVCMYDQYDCMYVCSTMYILVCMYDCMYVCSTMCVYMYVCTYVRMCVCTYVRMYVLNLVCMYAEGGGEITPPPATSLEELFLDLCDPTRVSRSVT